MEVWGGNRAADRWFTMPGLEVCVYSQPHDLGTSGGDVYYLSSCVSGRITRTLLADVSGHGERVSNIAVGLRDLMRRNVNFINQSRFVEEMNQQFADAADRGVFATALACSYFASKRSWQFCSAGHPNPLIYRKAEQQWSILNETGEQAHGIADMALGVLDDTDYSQSQTTLEPGDLLLAFSDALIEAVDEHGRQLGLDGLLQLVQEIDTRQPVAIIRALLDKLRWLHSENLKQDDVTAILMQATTTRPSLKDNLLSPIRVFRDAVDNSRLD